MNQAHLDSWDPGGNDELLLCNRSGLSGPSPGPPECPATRSLWKDSFEVVAMHTSRFRSDSDSFVRDWIPTLIRRKSKIKRKNANPEEIRHPVCPVCRDAT